MLSLSTAILALAGLARATSHVALFTDSNCQDSYKALDGPNGYPNGSCTDIRRSGEYGSLQVVGLDPGCAVTIYVNDPSTTICGGHQQEIQLGECWNSTWVYYSIDMCDISALNNPESIPGFTISTPSSTTPSTSTPTPTASSAPISSSAPAPSTSVSPGVLAGAILGSLVALALLLAGILWFLRKKRQQRNGTAHRAYAEVEANPYRGEMDASWTRHEMEQGKDVYKHEVVEAPSPVVELQGSVVWRTQEEGGQRREGEGVRTERGREGKGRGEVK